LSQVEVFQVFMPVVAHIRAFFFPAACRIASWFWHFERMCFLRLKFGCVRFLQIS